jgi:hypothetical protein
MKAPKKSQMSGSKVKFNPNRIVANPSKAAKTGGKSGCGCK